VASRKRPDLTRTRAALAVFDAAGDAWEAKPTQATQEVMESAREALASAFAADTADKNDAATVRDFVLSLAGMTFVRRMLAHQVAA
jgi:hypothetical protein